MNLTNLLKTCLRVAQLPCNPALLCRHIARRTAASSMFISKHRRHQLIVNLVDIKEPCECSGCETCLPIRFPLPCVRHFLRAPRNLRAQGSRLEMGTGNKHKDTYHFHFPSFCSWLGKQPARVLYHTPHFIKSLLVGPLQIFCLW